jgi:hypothetical protein
MRISVYDVIPDWDELTNDERLAAWTAAERSGKISANDQLTWPKTRVRVQDGEPGGADGGSTKVVDMSNPYAAYHGHHARDEKGEIRSGEHQTVQDGAREGGEVIDMSHPTLRQAVG